jgi:hypothetical protein
LLSLRPNKYRRNFAPCAEVAEGWAFARPGRRYPIEPLQRRIT